MTRYTTPMPFQYNDIIDAVQGAGRSLQFFRLLVGAVADIPVGSQVDLKLTMPQQVMASAYRPRRDRDRQGISGRDRWVRRNRSIEPPDPREREAPSAQSHLGVRLRGHARRLAQTRNPDREAYFGETHVHTSWSLDAWLFGNRITNPGDAYKSR